MNKIKKNKIIDKINELQKAIIWLENESDGTKSGIFYWEQLGPIYRELTSLKKDITEIK